METILFTLIVLLVYISKFSCIYNLFVVGVFVIFSFNFFSKS